MEDAKDALPEGLADILDGTSVSSSLKSGLSFRMLMSLPSRAE